MNVTNRPEKVEEKTVSFVQFQCFFPELWSLYCPKYAFFADITKKPKSLTAICMYTLESSYNTLSENNMVYKGLSHCS